MKFIICHTSKLDSKKDEEEEDEVEKLERQLAKAKKEKAIKNATKNITNLRESEVSKVEEERQQLIAQLNALSEKQSQILSGLYDEDLIQAELKKSQTITSVKLNTDTNTKIKKIVSEEDQAPRVRDTSKARARPNLSEIFNTDTLIKFKVGSHHTLIYEVEQGGMFFNEKKFTTLSSVITEIKLVEDLTKSRQYNAYDFTEWFCKKEDKFKPTSPYFTVEELEKKGKLN
jgi:hypothetical protein